MFRRSLFFVSASLCPVYMSFLSWCVCFPLGFFPSAVVGKGKYYRYIKCGSFRKAYRALWATNHGSRSKTRESPESISSCTGPTNTAEGAQRGSQRRERRSWETLAGCGRRRSGDGPPLGSRREAPRRATRPARGDPCRIVARLLTLNAYEYASAEGRDLLVPHGPHSNSRDLNDRRFGGGAGMRCLRKVFGQSHAQRQCPVNITWHQESLQTQHLGVGHAFPREGLS